MKIRLDQYLVQNGLVQSRERAKALIMAGVVFVNQQKVDKAGEMIKEDAVVRSICAISERYGGLTSFAAKDGQFTLRVML